MTPVEQLDSLARRMPMPMHVYVELRASILRDGPEFFEAVEFFLEHGSSVLGLHYRSDDVVSAARHAAAEAHAKESNWEVSWRYDYDGLPEALLYDRKTNELLVSRGEFGSGFLNRIGNRILAADMAMEAMS